MSSPSGVQSQYNSQGKATLLTSWILAYDQIFTDVLSQAQKKNIVELFKKQMSIVCEIYQSCAGDVSLCQHTELLITESQSSPNKAYNIEYLPPVLGQKKRLSAEVEPYRKLLPKAAYSLNGLIALANGGQVNANEFSLKDLIPLTKKDGVNALNRFWSFCGYTPYLDAYLVELKKNTKIQVIKVMSEDHPYSDKEAFLLVNEI